MNAAPVTLALVGAGPRATGLLERLAANSAALWGDRPLHIHLIDPYPPGVGRVWRGDQSPLLRMNSMAEDVTMFTDESSLIEGPVRPGPSLAEWAASLTRGRRRPAATASCAHTTDRAVRDELRELAPTDFPTRRAQSAYLDWVFRRTLDQLPAHVTVRTHRTRAVALTGPRDGPQALTLAARAEPLLADLVVLTQGHLGSQPAAENGELADFAHRHGRTYLPPAFSADTTAELAGIAAGEHAILRGMGLAFVDLVTLLTEGRGGGYRRASDGTLTYEPSGREPVLHVGSRRGVPYHSKTGYRLQGPRPPLPRYFGPAAIDSQLAYGRPLDLRGDLWPLMAKEIGFGYYHELFHAHPARTRLPWPGFLAAYDRLDWYSDALRALIAHSVPDPADRLDFEALDRPLDGLVFASGEDLTDHLLGYLTADVERRQNPAHSADLGAFLALLSVYGQLPKAVASGALTAHAVGEQLDGWWQGFFSFLASGPPGFRLQELKALVRAGVVRFLGAGLSVRADEATGRFLASGTSLAGQTEATALVEAYLPRPSAARSQDGLLRSLHAAGELAEETLSDATATHRTGLIRVDPDTSALYDPRLGGAHPRRYALGAHTNGRGVAAFARPRTNAPVFRQNDTVARELLRQLARCGGGKSTPADRAALTPSPTPSPLPSPLPSSTSSPG